MNQITQVISSEQLYTHKIAIVLLPRPNSINDVVFYRLHLDYENKLKYSLIMVPKAEANQFERT